MKDIAIYGAGGFGRETALLIKQINQQTPQWNLVGFYDDALAPGTMVGSHRILGSKKDVKPASVISIVVAVSDPSIRKSIVGALPPQIEFPTLIHPLCQVGDDNNRIGKGCILTSGVILTTNIHIGDFVIVNLSSTVGHDATLGDFTTIMPGCSLSGNVKAGECTMIGTGARILQNLTIGARCKIGAGAVVTQDFSADKTIIGVPAHEK